MSLQSVPPILLPQTSLEPSLAPADGLPLSEKSYLRRLFEDASGKTREHQKVELIAVAIAASIAAFLGGASAGIASGIAAALLTLATVLVIIFSFIFCAPPKLSTRIYANS